MEDDQEQRPESLLPYEQWIETALRQVVAQAIEHAGVHGLPGGHHFYVTFRTDHPGVVIPPRLRAQYPQEMTIVLQHQFWDLRLNRETQAINVGLSFGGIPSTLVIPLDAVVSFADPQVRYGLRFRPVMPDQPKGEQPEPGQAQAGQPQAGQPRTLAPVPNASQTAEAEAEPGAAGQDAGDKPAEKPQVVSLDAFRRRTPPKT